MSIKIVRELSEDIWRYFVDEHPQGNIFHTPEMFQVFCRTRGYHPELWAAMENGHVLALLLPVKITLMKGLLRFLTTRAVVYGSVLFKNGLKGQKALSKILHSYKKEVRGFPLFTELRNISNLSNIQQILNENGFIYEDQLNYLIELNRPEEEIWRSFDRKRRQEIKRAPKKGLVIEEVSCAEKIEIVHQILRKVFSRIKVPLADISLFRAAYDLLTPRNLIKIILAKLDDQYIGANVALTYKKRIFGWYCGFDRTFSSYFPESLMYWHQIQWGRENGFEVFDLGGAGKPNEDYGPRRFKAKWGGILVNYGRNTYVHAPLGLKLSNLGYQLLRRFL